MSCQEEFYIKKSDRMIDTRGWDKSPSLSIILGLLSKTQWLSGFYYADFISFYSPTQLCGGGTTKSNSNELPISVPLSLMLRFILPPSFYGILVLCNFSQSYESRAVLQASEGVRDFCRIGIKTNNQATKTMAKNT